MPLTDLIDKLDTLITNQRPVSELKPHLASLREHTEALESRVSTLETEAQNNPLAKECETLRSQLQDAQREIEKLRTATPAKVQTGNRRSEVEDRILLFLTDDRGPTSRAIARELGLSLDRVESHLADLFEDMFAYSQRNMDQDTTWHLGTDGQRYLTRNNLVQ